MFSEEDIFAFSPKLNSDGSLKEISKFSLGGGLYLFVRASGSRSFVFRFTKNGINKEVGLGFASKSKFGGISLLEAREKISDIKKSANIKKSKKLTDSVENKQNFVYFISNGQSVKIGTSVNVENRLKQLQISSDRKLNVLLTLKGGTKLEKILHRKFKDYRINGEWFTLSTEILSFINKTPET